MRRTGVVDSARTRHLDRFHGNRRRFRVLGLAVLVLAAGTAQGGFRLFDAFEDETVGPIGGQDGWSSSGGDNRVVVDPADATNQTMYVPSDSSNLRKSLLVEDVGIPDGTVRMMFTRVRVGNKQTFSFGVSGSSYPTEFGDFATEIGMANSTQNLDLRAWDEDDGGRYEVLTQFTPDTWYSMWVLVDAVQNSYEIWLNDTPGAGAAASDKLMAEDGSERFDFRTGTNRDLFTFFIKTAGGGSGTNFGPVYFDDIYFELAQSLNLTNPAVPNSAPQVRGLFFAEDKETLLWNSLAWTDEYDVVKGDLVTLRGSGGDFASAVTTCLENDLEADRAQDFEQPGEGQGYFYLVRGVAESGITGTYDSEGPAQAAPRDAGVEASPAACL